MTAPTSPSGRGGPASGIMGGMPIPTFDDIDPDQLAQVATDVLDAWCTEIRPILDDITTILRDWCRMATEG
jgi:hypothetical protein